MNKKKKQKIVRYSIAASVVVLFVIAIIVSIVTKDLEAKQFEQKRNTDVMEFNPFIENERRLDNSFLEYGKVLSKYLSAGYPLYQGNPLELRGMDYIPEKSTINSDVKAFTEDYVVDGEVALEADQTAVVTSTSKVTLVYNLDVPETALYNLEMLYGLFSGKSANMLIGLTINGKQPFIESSYFEVKRMYEFYEYDRYDDEGNQIRAKQREVFGWQKAVLTHPDGFYRNPYLILLQKGTNTIEISFSREAGVIKTISFVAPTVNPTYDEYLNMNGFSEDKIYKGEAKQIELEVPVLKNDITIRAEWNDDYYSYPPSYDLLHYNIFGGARWKDGGTSAKWTFEVPETGWYQLSFRYSSSVTYVAAYREIKIDGAIPFEDMEEYCFPYSDGWVLKPLMDKDQKPFMFYLEEGTHEIEITAKVGPLRHDIQRIEECIESISSLVRRITQLVAATRQADGSYAVQANMDWDLQEYIPDIVELLESYSKNFYEIYDNIKEANGGKAPYYGSAIKVAAELFKSLAEDTEEVPGAINEVNDTIAGISNTIIAAKEQPVAFDYMIISEKGYTQKARSGFWQNLYVGAKKFYWSFVKDYSAIGAPIIEDEDIDKYPTISVYVATGREHVEILRRMISDEFTRDHRIKVDVNMVAGGVEGQIMLRYVAGNAPDVAISVGAGTPFEYAIRGALLPLNQFEGFEELKKSYIDDAFNPYLYKGNYYAFPETQSWVALFYRTDIIVDELQLDPPDTWEDVYEMLPVLQEKGYDFYYPYAPGNYIPFLFQHGGNVYDEHAMTSSLDTVEAYNAFKEYADLYIKYKIPYAANFYQRFRNGTIPIGIDGHGFFSQLMVAAPELKGKWDMAPIPGHKLSDGSVVRYAGGLGTCSIIISSTEYPEEAWKFIQWWSSDEVQTQYGQEVEATFGVASRWNPANVEALKTLPYTEKEMSVILEQWSHFKEAHNTLGGYYTHRYLNTALNQTILQGKNARIALEDAVKEINKEMLRKQKEFGITDSVLYPSDSSN